MTANRDCARLLLVLVLIFSGRAALAITISPPQHVGTISTSTLSETSGIVGSRSLPGILWVHNDSGDSARFYAINAAGALQGTFSLTGATATDWEDIAMGPKAGGGNYLYLGDIGDNDANRSQIAVYRTDEPQVATGGTIAATGYKKALLQYPGGPRNAESLMVDPLTGDLFIITKTPSGQIYSAVDHLQYDGGHPAHFTGKPDCRARQAERRRHLARRFAHLGPRPFDDCLSL